MNANTRLRLWKETRALLPMWAAMAALMVVPFLLQLHDPLNLAWSAYCFGCVLLGSAVLGQEFQHRTIGLLLSQPVSRRRLWWEKMFVLVAALLSLLLWLVVLGLRELDFVRSSFPPRDDHFGLVTSLLFPLLLGFSTGPMLTLLARSTIGGIALTFLCAWSVWLLVYLLLPFDHDGRPNVTALSFLFLISFGLYPGALFLLGCRRFQRLEDMNLLAQEFAAPRQFDNLFARLTAVLAPGRDSQLANLLRKEVRLQRPAVFVAVFLVALWLAFIVARRVHPALGAEVLIVPSILLGLGIPVIAGIVAVAEERSLGVHEWHLTLPVSARRQWGVKVLVALGVNVAFGILLPGLLAHASSWLADNPQLVAEIPGSSVPPLLIANVVIFCASLYASTASANSMRALIGTIVLFLAGAMVLNFADYVIRSHPQVVYQPGSVHQPPESLRSIHFHRWHIGWSCLSVWLYFLGFAGFRRSLESCWQPVRRMVLFFAIVCAFVFAALVG